MLVGVDAANLDPAMTQNLKDAIGTALVPFTPIKDQNGNTQEPEALETLTTAVSFATEKDLLVPNVFAAYQRRNCKSKLGYAGACKLVKNYYPEGIGEDFVNDSLSYLNDLNALRLAVRALYRKLDPNLVVNGKPLSEHYQNFKDHYAFETVFGYIRF